MKLLYNTVTQLLQPYPREDDADVIGLDTIYNIYSLVQEDVPLYNQSSHHIAKTESIDHANQLVTRGWNVIENAPTPSPPVVSMIGMLHSMIDADLYDPDNLNCPLTTVINNISDPIQKGYVKVYFDKSQVVERRHPVVISLQAALGLTDEQVNALFISAQEKDRASFIS